MGCGSSVQATQPTPSDQRILSAPVSPVVETENDPPMTSDPEHVGFRVNPEPHEEFFPTYSPTALELKCRSTIAKLGPRSSEESARKEMEELIRQWRESGKLADIESYSLSTPPSQSRSITELSEYLTRSTSNYVKAMEGNELHIQVAKAYCIYSWIAHNITYDSQLWQAYQFGDDSSLQHSTRAEQVIDRRMTVSSGYANLFKSIASASGLKVEVICGNIKEWKTLTMSSPKEDFKASRNNTHAWNSITIGGIAYLVDCTLGSGCISSNAEHQQVFTSQYFAVKPQEFILTHWPQRASQQLLKKSLAFSEFCPLIPLSCRASEHELNPDTWSELLEVPIEVYDPVVCISMTCKVDVKILAKLSVLKQELEDSNELANCVFVHREISSTEKGTSNLRIRAVVPSNGQYVLNVYACKSSSHTPGQNYQLVLSYQIVSHIESGNQSRKIGFPVVYDMAAAAFDFQVLHWNKPMPDYCCENASGKLDIVFRAKPDLQFFHYIVPGDAENPDDPDSFLMYNTLVAQNKCGDPSFYALRCVFPSSGYWSVHLNATKVIDNDSQRPTVSGYTSVLKYLVYVENSVNTESFPHISAPYISLDQPETISASGNDILSVRFYSTREHDFYTYLTFEVPTGEPLESYTIVSAEDTQREERDSRQHYKLGVIFPKPGRWYIHVCGRNMGSADQNFTALFVLNVLVEGALSNKKFPKIYSSIAAALNFSCYDSGCVTFADDGSPFTYKFRAPSSGVNLVPSITPRNADDSEFDEAFLQQCVLLSPSVVAGSNSKTCVYTINAVFPSAGKWSLQLFGCLSDSHSGDYNVVIYIQFQVSKPTPNLCYPTIFPGFYNLGLSIPNELLLFSRVIDSSEMRLPFSSSKGVVFETRLTQKDKVFVNQAIVEHIEDAANDINNNSVKNRMLHIIFPKAGDWVMHLYAGKYSAEKGDNDDSHQHVDKEAVLELKIKSLSFNETLAFPQIFDPFYSKFSLRLAEEQYPLVSRVNHFPSKVTIAFYSSPDVRFWHSVKLSSSTGENSMTRLNSDPHTGLCELSVEVTEPGQWIVMLYAKKSDALDSQKWIAVLLHTIQAL